MMTRRLFVALFVLLVAVPLVAQAPKGWKLRADRSTSAADPDAPGAIKFVAVRTGFHATNPQAAVFSAERRRRHLHAQGHVHAGQAERAHELLRPRVRWRRPRSPSQNYIYFLVAQDGAWLVKRRDGDPSTQTVTAKTPHDAVRKPDASGTSTNTLEVRMSADKIEYVVNGTVVNTTPKSGMTAKTDGIYDIRVNHQLEVKIDGFGVTKP